MKRAVLLAAALLPACIDLDSTGLHRPNPDFLVIGHRGAPHEEPENTLPSFRRAVELGASAVEMDLAVTADGEIVVWHDRDPADPIARLRQDGSEPGRLPFLPFVPDEADPAYRPVGELTLAELRASYGYKRRGTSTRLASAAIPLLEEALAWATNEDALRAVFLDVKVESTDLDGARAILQAADAAIPRSTGATWTFLSVHRAVATLYRDEIERPDFRAAWDFEKAGGVSGALRLGLRDAVFGLTVSRSESSFMDELEEGVAAREEGRLDSVVVYTIDKPTLVGPVLYRGADGVMSNRPGDLHELWQLTL